MRHAATMGTQSLYISKCICEKRKRKSTSALTVNTGDSWNVIIIERQIGSSRSHFLEERPQRVWSAATGKEKQQEQYWRANEKHVDSVRPCIWTCGNLVPIKTSAYLQSGAWRRTGPWLQSHRRRSAPHVPPGGHMASEVRRRATETEAMSRPCYRWYLTCVVWLHSILSL